MGTPIYAHPLSGVTKVPDGATTVDIVYVDDERNPQEPPASGGGSAEIADGAVTTAKLANGAVTSDKIKAGNVTGYNIANGTVTADKLASGVLPTNATKEKAGLVKQAAHVADPAADTPTKQEYIALRDALVTAGIMSAS